MLDTCAELGGGTYAVDLNTGRALAWITYWTYGDYNPISHHLCAFPSADPVQGFEWINSTQGGKNFLIYGIPSNIETSAEGFNIYRVRYDGSQMELMENVSETTGLGLGVHVTIDPETAERYFVTDGQKDLLPSSSSTRMRRTSIPSSRSIAIIGKLRSTKSSRLAMRLVFRQTAGSSA
jgi:thiocyanate desulfurase